MTDTEVARIVAVLLAAFPAAKASPNTSAVYERMLGDLDYRVANAAVERLIATAKWLPTVADIREACLTLSAGEKTPGGEAWGMVLKAVRLFGYVRSPGVDFDFPDPITQRCVAALGWSAICASENMAADRARFIELYDKLAAADRARQLADGLPAHKRLEAHARARLEAGKETT